MQSERYLVKLIKQEFKKRGKKFDKSKLKIIKADDIFVDVSRISAVCVSRSVSKHIKAGKYSNQLIAEWNEFKIPDTYETIPSVHLLKPNSLHIYSCKPSQPCTSCDGGGNCIKCNSKGKLKCNNCNGRGYCNEKRCYKCNGSGRMTCIYCNGTGGCPKCHGSGNIKCNKCAGTGNYSEYETYDDEYEICSILAWNKFSEILDKSLIYSLEFKDEETYKDIYLFKNGKLNCIAKTDFPDEISKLIDNCSGTNIIKIGEQKMKGIIHRLEYEIGDFKDTLYYSDYNIVHSSKLEQIKYDDDFDESDEFEYDTYEENPTDDKKYGFGTILKWIFLIISGLFMFVIPFKWIFSDYPYDSDGKRLAKRISGIIIYLFYIFTFISMIYGESHPDTIFGKFYIWLEFPPSVQE